MKSALLLSLFVIGCSKSTPGPVKRPDISEMSVHDALYTKYEKLQLYCGADIAGTKRGPYVVWDILKFYAPEKTFLFRETVGDVQLTFEARGKLTLVRAVDYAVGSKAVHAIDVARFDGAPAVQSLAVGGQVTVARDNPPFTLTDSQPVPLVQSALASGAPVRLECTLRSQVKPGFETDVSAL